MVSWQKYDKNLEHYYNEKTYVQQMVTNNDGWISHKKRLMQSWPKNDKLELIVIIYSVICDANNCSSGV